MPPFTTKQETWTVWFAQFEAIADDNEWSESEMLSMFLPKLQGTAGEYVLEVLPHTTRSDDKRLVRELDARYQKVESKHNYCRQLNGISQKYGESEQESGAKIKRLYDKAYLNQGCEVHQEDLLNLFFGALADDNARRTVEFHKDPHDINEAVDHVVYYCETGRHAKASDEKCQQNARATRAEPAYSDKETSSSDNDSRVA